MKYPDWFYSTISAAFQQAKGNVEQTLASCLEDLVEQAPDDPEFLTQLIRDAARAVVHDLREQHNRSFRKETARPTIPLQPPVSTASSKSVQETARTAAEIRNEGMGYFISLRGGESAGSEDDVQDYTKEQLEEAYKREQAKAAGCVRRAEILKALKNRVPKGKTVRQVLTYEEFRKLVVRVWNAKSVVFKFAPTKGKEKGKPELAEAGH